jgi:hypothetical protein
MSSPGSDPLFDAVLGVVSALERLRIRYCVVGSLASATRGIFRGTEDADLVVAMTRHQVAGFVEELGKDWYADEDTIRYALEAGRSFNVIHMPNAQKVDVFPPVTEFQYTGLKRATPVEIKIGGGTICCPVASAEDTILAKLDWYRLGGQTSERQWQDITGVIATNPDLDWAYLDEWACELRLDPLLAKALADAAA